MINLSDPRTLRDPGLNYAELAVLTLSPVSLFETKN